MLFLSHGPGLNEPPFDLPFERRRLRILNGLFLAVGRMNGKPSFYGHEARECHVSFYQQHVRVTLDQPIQSSRRGNVTTSSGSNDGNLSLSFDEGPNTETTLRAWQDSDGVKLETQMTEVAIEIVLTAEIRYRERAIHQHKWRVERKAELEEEGRQQKLKAERVEKEQQKRIEQARIDRLISDAAAFQQAGEIREYVEAIRLAVTQLEPSSRRSQPVIRSSHDIVQTPSNASLLTPAAPLGGTDALNRSSLALPS
jgi:hypothetical protein